MTIKSNNINNTTYHIFESDRDYSQCNLGETFRIIGRYECTYSIDSVAFILFAILA